MAQLLMLLENQTEAIFSEDHSDLELMVDIMHYMTVYPDAVHHPKEDKLYANCEPHARTYRKAWDASPTSTTSSVAREFRYATIWYWRCRETSCLEERSLPIRCVTLNLCALTCAGKNPTCSGDSTEWWLMDMIPSLFRRSLIITTLCSAPKLKQGSNCSTSRSVPERYFVIGRRIPPGFPFYRNVTTILVRILGC